MPFLLIPLFFGTLAASILLGRKQIKRKLTHRASNVVAGIHFAGLAVICFVIILHLCFGAGLRGLWTTRIFIFITLASGLFAVLFATTRHMRKAVQIYFDALSWFPVGVAILSAIPVLGALLLITLIVHLVEPAQHIYHNDAHIRVQSTFGGVMGLPTLDIYEKRCIFEWRVEQGSYEHIEPDSVRVVTDADSTRIYIYSRSVTGEGDSGETTVIALEN